MQVNRTSRFSIANFKSTTGKSARSVKRASTNSKTRYRSTNSNLKKRWTRLQSRIASSKEWKLPKKKELLNSTSFRRRNWESTLQTKREFINWRLRRKKRIVPFNSLRDNERICSRNMRATSHKQNRLLRRSNNRSLWQWENFARTYLIQGVSFIRLKKRMRKWSLTSAQ